MDSIEHSRIGVRGRRWVGAADVTEIGAGKHDGKRTI